MLCFSLYFFWLFWHNFCRSTHFHLDDFIWWHSQTRQTYWIFKKEKKKKKAVEREKKRRHVDLWSMFIAGFVATSVKQLFVADILLFVTFVCACMCVSLMTIHITSRSLLSRTMWHKSMDIFGTLRLFCVCSFEFLLFTLCINVSASKLMLIVKVPIKFLYKVINVMNDHQRTRKK